MWVWQEQGHLVLMPYTAEQLNWLVKYCKAQLGKSHGQMSDWQVVHRSKPNPPGTSGYYPKRQAVIVRNLLLKTQLSLMFA